MLNHDNLPFNEDKDTRFDCILEEFMEQAARHNSTSSKSYMDKVKPILEQSCMVSGDGSLFYVTCSCYKLKKIVLYFYTRK